MRAGRIALVLAFPFHLTFAAATLGAASKQEGSTIDLFEPSSQRQGAPTGGKIPGLPAGLSAP